MKLVRIALIATLAALFPVAGSAQSLINVSTAQQLQDAIGSVFDGGVIELAAGTYQSPAPNPPSNPTGSFAIQNQNKRFTIRAASGATVILSGGGSRDIVRVQNSVFNAGASVTFQALSFQNGVSTTAGISGGVSIDAAQATFVSCTFSNNSLNPVAQAGGGALSIGNGSSVLILDSTFTNNSAKWQGGAIAIGTESLLHVHNSTFSGNRTDLPTHFVFSAGAGIHVANARLRVTNSRFENNRAGYVGGAIYAFGTWTDPVSNPRAEVIIANSLFTGNVAQRDAGVTNPTPTEGGAVHVEDQATMKIHGSRFVSNTAETGGAANNYRGILEITKSVFQLNRAVGTALGGTPTGGTGFGGAISVISNDANDATTGGGTINRRSSTLTITDSLFQGVSTAPRPQSGGCIYAGGDGNSTYGINGISPASGTAASNRAIVTVTRGVFNDCDTQQNGTVPGTGVGGILTDLADLTLTDSIVSKSDAVNAGGGANGTSGGGISALNNSSITLTNSTIAENTSALFGGGIFIQGSALNVTGSRLLRNSVSGGGFGSAIFSSPDTTRNINVTGTVASSTFSENTGAITLFDDDRGDGSGINALVYNSNTFFAAGGTVIDIGGLGGGVFPSQPCPCTPTMLNALTISRTSGGNTSDKGNGNTASGSAVVTGQIVAAPPTTYANGAPGEGSLPAYLGYAWGGAASATVAGTPQTTAGVDPRTAAGSASLVVGVQTFAATTTNSSATGATLDANPTAITGGQSTALNYNTTNGAFLAALIDNGIGAQSAGAGSANATPSASTTYRFHTVTDTGGAVDTAAVSVTGNLPIINSFTADPIFVSPGGASLIQWSVAPGSNVTFNNSSVAATGSLPANPGSTTSYVLTASNSGGSVSRTVTIHVNDGTVGLPAPTVTSPSQGQTIGVSGITFSWGAVGGGTTQYGIEIWRRPTGETVFSGSLVGAASTSTLISLPNGDYRFAVRACNFQGTNPPNCGLWGSVEFTVSLTAPTTAPAISSPTPGQTITNSTFSLTWTAVGGAVFYEVTLLNLTDNNTALSLSVPAPGTSTVVSVKGAPTNYRLTLKACQSACGPASTAVNFTVSVGAAPGAAPTITSAPLSGNQVTVNWTLVGGADLYQVQVVQPSGGPGGGPLTVGSRQVSTSPAVFPVPPGAANILVAACTGNGCGPFSTAFPINPGAASPATPTIGFPMDGTTVAGPTTFISWSRIPADNGSNTTYRLFVNDLSRQAPALDVRTTQNFFAAFFKAEGSRYDAVVIANPTGTPLQGPPSGFSIAGTSATAPTMIAPAHQSTVQAGNLQLGWSPVTGATLYEYFVAAQGQSAPTVRGVTPGLFVQVPLTSPATYNGIVRACPAGATCAAGSDAGWGPWSVDAGPGVTNFTVVP